MVILFFLLAKTFRTFLLYKVMLKHIFLATSGVHNPVKINRRSKWSWSC